MPSKKESDQTLMIEPENMSTNLTEQITTTSCYERNISEQEQLMFTEEDFLKGVSFDVKVRQKRLLI